MTDCQTETAPCNTDVIPLVLRPKGSESTSQALGLAGAKITIGAGQSCTHRLDQPGVRPLHCLITKDRSGMTIRRWSDETFLNGEVFTEASLSLGDWLTIGPVELEVTEQEVTEQAEPSSEAADPEDLLTLKDHASASREEVHRVRSHGRQRAERLLGALRAARSQDQATRDQVEALRAEIHHLEELQTSLEEQRTRAEQERVELQEGSRLAEEQAEAQLEAVRQQIAERNELVAELQAELERQQEELQRLTGTIALAEVNTAFLEIASSDLEIPASDFPELDLPELENRELATETESVVNVPDDVPDEATDEATDVADDEADDEAVDADKEPVASAPLEESVGGLDHNDSPPPAEEPIVKASTAEGDPTAEGASTAESELLWDIETKPETNDTEIASADAAQSFGQMASTSDERNLRAPLEELESVSSDRSSENLGEEPASLLAPHDNSNDDSNEISNEGEEAAAEPSEQLVEPSFDQSSPEEMPEESPYEDLWASESTDSAVVESPAEATASEASEQVVPETSIPETSAFDEPAPTDKKPEAPVSFIEQYSHLLPDDEADTPESVAPVESPSAVVAMPVAMPVTEETSSDDQSMEDYMSQMMARLRGDEASAPLSSPAPGEVTSAPAPEPVCEPAVQPLPLTDLKELKGGPTPEQTTDMSALRDLANDSARNAIQVAGVKRDRETAITHLALCVMAAGFGGYAVFASGGQLQAPLVGGLAVMTAGGVWACRTLSSMIVPVR